jgi:Tol biopolymer transport system component
MMPMTNERWQRAKTLFQAAVDRPEAERDAFLIAATGEDETLRREVESLLYSDGADLGLLDRLPIASEVILTDHFAVLSASADTDLSTALPDSDSRTRFGPAAACGVRVGPYEVVAPLGAGGMGEVYRARDTTLNRDVALKVLSAQFALDPDRLARFTREAQTLASLNHPNIAAIYGLEQSGDVQALVLELVEGDTLAERLAATAGSTQAGLPMDRALDYAHQIAAALEAAHEKGITHCDLKPANIQITPHGVVKLLDFGIAKVLTDDPGTPGATIAGLIAGTPGYMSPEQASGKDVDRRTDVWAFGCLFYELLTGKRAFRGRTLSDTIEAALEREPDWEALPGATPRRIRALLERCLHKNATHRLQAIADARRTIERAQRGWGRWQIAATAAAALAALAIGAGVWWRGPAPPPDRSTWIQLTNLPDSVIQPALSRDGRMVAFLRGPSRASPHVPGQVYVKTLPDGEPVQLTNDALEKMSPVFSPDGERIAYTTVDRNFGWDTWRVSVLGGEPQRWLRNASGLVWARSGTVLFSEIKQSPHMGIVAARESRTEQGDVYLPPQGRGMAHRSYPSPDGKSVLVVEMDHHFSWTPCRLIPMDRTSPGRLIGPRGAGCTFAAWSPDGRWMYVTSDTGGANHIWRQRFPDGEPEQITFGPTEEEGVAIAPDGRSFVTAVALQNVSVWLHEAGTERQIGLEGNAVNAQFTPDGKKLCYKVVKQAFRSSWDYYGVRGEVRVTDLETGRSEALMPGFQALDYDLSADGQQVVIEVADRDGTSRFWLATLSPRGHAPRQIPNAQGRLPRFGPDGDIFFRRTEGASAFVYRVRPDGTGMRKAFERPIQFFGDISRDGRWITAFARTAENEGHAWQALPLDGGPAVPIAGFNWRWSPKGDSVSISPDSGLENRSYIVPLEPGEALPRMPAGGFRSERDVAALPGARKIDAVVVPGPSLDVYAFYRTTTQRNLYRIPIPEPFSSLTP